MISPPPREERVPVSLDIRLWGLAADGRAFSQHGRVHNISASGALLCEIEHDLKIGDTIGVQFGHKKARCKVAWTRDTRSIQKIKVGVQLLGKLECPWHDLLPKSNRNTTTATAARRRWVRHKIDVPITLFNEQNPFHVMATDISGRGCYVEMLSPFPLGAAVGAELWTGAERLTTRALVRTCDPRVGMGIEFVSLKTEDQLRLQNHLQAIDPFSCSIEAP